MHISWNNNLIQISIFTLQTPHYFVVESSTIQIDMSQSPQRMMKTYQAQFYITGTVIKCSQRKKVIQQYNVEELIRLMPSNFACSSRAINRIEE